MSTNVWPNNISWTIQPFVTKHDMVVYYHESGFPVEKLVCSLQAEVHSKGFYNENIAVSPYFLNCWPFCNQTWSDGTFSYTGVSREKKRIIVLKVKVTMKLRNADECLSGQYLLNYRTFYYQSWYGDASSWAGLKRLACCLQGQGHSEDFIWSYSDFLLCPLNCWSFCYQILFDGVSWIIFEKIRFFCCVQGHSKGSKFQWIFIWMISSQRLNLL